MNSTSVTNETQTNDSVGDNSDLKVNQYSLFVTNVVICSLNLLGNTTVLILICKRRLLGRTTNVFIFSLAMADAICAIGAIPYNLHLAQGRSMSVYMCKGYFYALCVSRTAVSYTVIMLTTEKILNILHPSRFITAGRCMFFISLVWFFSAAYNVWAVVFYTIYDSDQITTFELLSDSGKILYGKACFFSRRFVSLRSIFLSLDLCVLFIVPCTVLSLECFVIVRKQHGSIKQRFETYFYIMSFIFFIFIVFITCHTPFEISTVLKSEFPSVADSVNTFYDVSTTIYYCRGILFLGVYVYFKQYVCRRNKLRTANNANKSQHLELPLRRNCRGLSLNEQRHNRTYNCSNP
ncbi:QRFP-like peptide receptor [Dreissena polymorpha]|uniref:QRFP-like peptide receptor n=1 Tax=Dreissena polymorpha TaxID=45954 RepID=UPI002264E0CD|nr:QRFP-like peptide receptor [Dreissena polymorpha]